ncbi:MAG: citrate synthase [Polyangiaceae bacterium]
MSDGLEGVVVARTALSEVDGQRGELTVAGASIEALAGAISFEELFARLAVAATGAAAKGVALDAAAVRVGLGAARVAAFEVMRGRPSNAADAMDELRERVAALDISGSEHEGLALTGALAVAAAMHARRRLGLEFVAPDPRFGHAADFLRMVLGDASAADFAARARALEAYLVTVADHGLNASTFAARVVASTGSDMVSAITAAIGALKGPLHGGAPGPVLDMLDAIGEPERAEAWLDAELSAGRRIMGMGHRVYRVRDPRAAVLERALGGLESTMVGRVQTLPQINKNSRLELARAVESAAAGLLAKKHPARSLQANVEFYTAVLLDAVGLPRWLFAATFAVGRVAGWTAHVTEQRARGRLIRPESLYDGPRAE